MIHKTKRYLRGTDKSGMLYMERITYWLFWYIPIFISDRMVV